MRGMSTGTAHCLASGAAFGAMGIFGKLAYGEGATVSTLLAVRFTLAAALFWIVLAATRRLGAVRSLARRDVLAGLGLGACGYALQAGAYFAALERIDASLLALLVYTYPAIVTVAAIALGRDPADGRRLAALGLASAGLCLIVGAAGAGALDPLGTALGLTAAVACSAYILVSEGIARRVPPDLLAALVYTGAAATLTLSGLVGGGLRPGALTPAGWGWLACLATVSTVAAIGLFLAGLRRVGPSAAAILSTVEPCVAVLLAFLAFGETLTVAQLCGGAAVLAGVVALNARIHVKERLADAPAAG
jgi:drug/metabolite transporter (DMT)-like permease